MREAALSAILITVWLLVLTAGCATQGQAVPADPVRPAVERAMSRVYPALVRIHVVTANYRRGREQKWESAGSGTIISPEGYIVTNHHVVGKAKWIRCTLANKEQAEATLVGTDAMTDIAVIKLKPETMTHPVEAFPYAKWGDSSRLRVGDRVFAMGSPMTLSQSVTSGIVSNVEMVMPRLLRESKLTLDGENVGSIVRWIAHDAAIYGGNSGGPLVNLEGEIVGVNEIGIGLGGAIPSNLARVIADALILENEVRRSWIGLAVQPLLRSSGMKKGVLVGGVVEDSPADKAGLKPGDIITSYDGHAVTVRYPEEMPQLNRMVLETPVGKSVSVEFHRNKKHHTVTLKPVARGRAQAKDREIRAWGMNARDITPLTAIKLKRKNTDGVLVSSTRPGGPCGQARPKLRANDVIVKIGGKGVKNLAELEKTSAGITHGRDEPVPTIVAFERKAQHLLTVVKIGPSEKENVVPEVRKAWFPAAAQVFTRPLAKAMGLEGTKGIRITQLYPALQREELFKVGDIITHMDTISIEASEPEHADVFPAMVRQFKTGTEVTVTVLRNGKEIEIAYKLTQEPKPAQELKKYRDENFEFSAREMGELDRTEKQLPEGQRGVLVSGVDSGGWASIGRLAVGDILLSVNGVETPGISVLENVMKDLGDKKPEEIVFFVKRGIHTLFLELRPDWSRTER
jgi:serine protease Do